MTRTELTTPNGVLGAVELATRYGVNPSWARALLRRWADTAQGAPAVTRVSERRVVTAVELLRWEDAERRAGRSLPGERRRGPVPTRRTGRK